LGEPDVSDVAAFGLLAHRADFDDLPGQREIERRCLVHAYDLEPNLGSMPAVVLSCPASVCPDVIPSMNRAAPDAVPMTILGNLNLAFSSLVLGSRQAIIHRVRRDPAIPALQIQLSVRGNLCNFA
jgi:hypothetical protein